MLAGQVVERGAARAVLSAPKHPYTRALMETIPLVGMDRTIRLKAIDGMVPSPLNFPVGCRFANRCDFAQDRCHAAPPPLIAAGGSEAACWLVGEDLASPEQADRPITVARKAAP